MTDPRIPAPLRGDLPTTSDPLHWCVYATVALLTWAGGPAVLGLFALAGLFAYGRAFARGRRTSRCLLRDTRIVLVYLAAIVALAAVATFGG